MKDQQIKSKIARRVLTAALVLAAAFVSSRFVAPTLAGVEGVEHDHCAGNVCEGTLSVGGRQISYAYTQHVNPNGELRIRLDGGVYDTDQLISFILFDLPPFASWGKFSNPDVKLSPAAVFLPEEDVNPGRNAYERRDSDGCSGCRVDQVMSVRFSGAAVGKKTFNLFVLQNGASGGQNGLEFFIDAGAPLNTSEADAWDHVNDMSTPCADHFSDGRAVDNDLNYYANCADVVCDGLTGLIGTDKICENPETTLCMDEFDNDGDGQLDCADSGCDQKLGRAVPPAYCQYGFEAGVLNSLFGSSPCGDLFDNDADGLIDCYDNRDAAGARYNNPAEAAGKSEICWRQPAFGCPLKETVCTKNNTGIDDDIDKAYSDNEYEGFNAAEGKPTGKDCRDYDCAGDPNCPAQENQDADGNPAECQCFNGEDDDLDRLIDCRDPDCVGAFCEEKGSLICHDKEFDLGQRIQLCSDVFDNDGDVAADCKDTDCKQKFGDCGPCPNREDFQFSSCGDGKDNDADGLKDCQDPDCLSTLDPFGHFFGSGNAAYCLAAESGASCGDGFDNDADGRADCRDDGCTGADGPAGIAAGKCEPGRELNCSDGYDNDGDGLVDCADADCDGQNGCAASASWRRASVCPALPDWSAWKRFTDNGSTVEARTLQSVRISVPPVEREDWVEIRGSSSYPSVTIVIGDNTDTEAVYPYASELCEISPAWKNKFTMTVIAGRAIMLVNKDNDVLGDFDFTLTCPSLLSPAATKNYPISISVLKSGDVPEYGEASFSTRLYEATSPSISDIEVAGEIGGVLAVPYGYQPSFRVVPNDGDPNDDLSSSAICSCGLTIPGQPVMSSGGDCRFDPELQLTDDAATWELQASTLDVPGNASAVFARTLSLDIQPAVIDDLVVTKKDVAGSSPFFNSETAHRQASFVANFQTANNSEMTASCLVYVANSEGMLIGGPGPTITIPNTAAPGASVAYCNSTFDIPDLLASPGNEYDDGTYFLRVAAVDADGAAAFTSKKSFFKCFSVPDAAQPGYDANDGNVCHWADFDSDLAAEGFFTTMYSEQPKACDNCVNLQNPAQDDANADGVGAECRTGAFGRCEIDTDKVCSDHSWGLDSNDDKECIAADDPLCCPAPSIKFDVVTEAPVPLQRCMDPYGICALGGEVCFTASSCPERGTCDGGRRDGLACNEETDCPAEERNDDHVCLEDRFICDDGPRRGEICATDADCPNASGLTVACLSADICENLMYPWIETTQGSVYSSKRIRAPEPPPAGKFNATFCIQTKRGVDKQSPPVEPPLPQPEGQFVFTSEYCGDPFEVPSSRYERPKSRNVYATVLGRVDLKGLLAGKYGEVVNVEAEDFVDSVLGRSLGGKVYVVEGSLIIPGNDPDAVPPIAGIMPNTIASAPQGERGAGTVIIKGGDLYIMNDLKYDDVPLGQLDALDRLASLGWIVLDVTDPAQPGYNQRGNVYIGKYVNEVVGSFLVTGSGGIYTVAPPATDSIEPLTINGLMVARQFHFSRSFKSIEQGSEVVVYDGRALANPPPGFEDVTKTMPTFSDLPIAQ
ncbi:MAG: hypothetical protein WCT10_01125 [Patescibacteria group bacterium]